MPRFANLDGSGPSPGSAVFRWAVLDRLTGRRRKSPPRAAIPVVAPDVRQLSVAPQPGEPARITWLGLGLSAALNAPIEETRFGVFRM